MSEWIEVAATAEFPPGDRKVVESLDAEILVVNLEGSFHAVNNICTHMHAELSEGELEDGEVVCPLHSAHFDLRTGEALTPPAFEDLETFAVKEADGKVWVWDEPND